MYISLISTDVEATVHVSSFRIHKHQHISIFIFWCILTHMLQIFYHELCLLIWLWTLFLIRPIDILFVCKLLTSCVCTVTTICVLQRCCSQTDPTWVRRLQVQQHLIAGKGIHPCTDIHNLWIWDTVCLMQQGQKINDEKVNRDNGL